MQLRTLSVSLLLAMLAQMTDLAGQVAGDPGVISVDGKLIQIEITQGVVGIAYECDSDVEQQAAGFGRKIERLTRQIEKHLALAEAQEDRKLSDQESLYRAASYTKKLVEKIELLDERIAFLDEQQKLTQGIQLAIDAYDVPAIKQLLHKKLSLDDENVAETAFQLAGFQELDGEYQDAWANYQKASNLQPENQLYMDAHGKNEF